MNELKTLSIPLFAWPWRDSCSPYADAVDQHVIDWVKEQQLVSDDTSLARIAEARFGWLAARCYPSAPLGLLQAIAGYLTWLFVVDDVLFDQARAPSPQTITGITSTFDVLEQAEGEHTTFFAERAWRDLCHLFREFLGVERFQHLAHGIRMMYGSTVLLVLGHLHNLPINVPQYETLRRYSIGVLPSFELIGITDGFRLHDAERYSPAVQKLTRHANNIISWSNDIYSFGDELQQRGRYENIVLAYVSEVHSFEQAIALTTQRITTELESFLEQSDKLSRLKSPPLIHYMEELQIWISGHQHWMQSDTSHYLTTLANNGWDHHTVDLELKVGQS